VSRCAQALGHCADRLLVAIGKDYGYAPALAKASAVGKANATARFGDQCHSSIETCRHSAVRF
jgi:hypothetical protein